MKQLMYVQQKSGFCEFCVEHLVFRETSFQIPSTFVGDIHALA